MTEDDTFDKLRQSDAFTTYYDLMDLMKSWMNADTANTISTSDPRAIAYLDKHGWKFPALRVAKDRAIDKLGFNFLD